MPDKITKKELENLREEVYNETQKIIEEDKNSTLKIAENGEKLIKKGANIITYCNTGALATYGIGTALGIILYAYQKGKINCVYPCETRPYLQGLRLTAWELKQNKIPFKLICDNMASWIMKTEKIDAVIIGADRIALNGDTANKIGSYQLAITAKFHNIPFYVAAPVETIDIRIKNGMEIKIEERKPDEIITINGIKISPDIPVRNPSFDFVPNYLITAIITEKGIIRNPDENKIKKHLNL